MCRPLPFAPIAERLLAPRSPKAGRAFVHSCGASFSFEEQLISHQQYDFPFHKETLLCRETQEEAQAGGEWVFSSPCALFQDGEEIVYHIRYKCVVDTKYSAVAHNSR